MPEAPPKILVVDDEEWMRDACGQILEPEGFEVVTADDGQTGLMLARRLSPDLILITQLMHAPTPHAIFASIET